jgi:hypothetical protein
MICDKYRGKNTGLQCVKLHALGEVVFFFFNNWERVFIVTEEIVER